MFYLKDINRLIWKGMSNIYLWEKFTFLKLRFSRKENLRKCSNFEEQKRKRYIRGNLYIYIIVFSCLFSTKPCLRFLSNCFIQEIKGFCQSSFGNEVDFRDMMNVSLNISAKNWNFKKLRHYFVNERAMIKTKLMSCTFLLAKEKTWKRTFNINDKLSQKCTEKEIMPFKTTVNWLFKSYVMLFTYCLFWMKTGAFQQ